MNRKITYLISPLLIFILYIMLTSSSGGINGVSVSGCTCHGSASPNTLITISGLPSGGYVNGSIYSLTISVTNTTVIPAAPNGLRDGFDMTASAGSFTAVSGTAVNLGMEIRHNTPKAPVAGTASWTFNWTAPSSGSANVTFNAAGNATNGDGGNGGGNGTDQWNKTSVTIYKSGASLSVTATASAITCNGGVSTITAVGAGPTVPYQFSRNGGSFQTSGSFTNNLAGIYTITVRDAALLTASTTLNIIQPSIIVIGTTSNTPIACNAGTSTITTSATGGTGTMNYRLNAGAYGTSSTFTNNLAGNYTITARDANLCTKTSTIVITQPSAMLFNNTVPVFPLCNGDATGNVTRTVSGGTGTINYTITPLGPQSNTNGIFTGLAAQGYTITATDANNCTKTTTISITQPSMLNFISTVATPPICNGDNGIISTTASGGTGTKTYTLQPLGLMNGTGTFTALVPQTYTIQVSDANSCTKTTAVTLTQPTQLQFNTINSTNPICNAGSTGTINTTASGGTGVLGYSIAPLGPQNNNTGNFSGLNAQQFTITVKDANNCSLSATMTLTDPAPVVVNAFDVNGCLGDSIPLLGLPVGGTFSQPNPYIGYSIPYTYTIADSNGCVGTATANIFSQSVDLESVMANPATVCIGGNSELSIKPLNLNCIPITINTSCFTEYINNVSLGSINNSTLCSPGAYYSDYSSTMSTTLSAGATYTISLSETNYFIGDQWGVWIDFNRNGVYTDPGEFRTFPASAPPINSTISTTFANIKIPTNAFTGVTKMRVRNFYLGPISPCATSQWGETEDYGISIIGGVNNSNPAFSYQWSNAMNSALASPTAGTTMANNILANEIYQVVVTSAEGCSASAIGQVNSGNENLISNPVANPTTVCPGDSALLSVSPIQGSANYCVANNINNSCSGLEFIQQVSFGSINHNTFCDTLGYHDYTNLSTNVVAGNTYSISLTDGVYSFGDTWGVWIDFNQNGTLGDPGEFLFINTHNATVTGNVTIPANAYNGSTRMRVRLIFAGNMIPCGNSVYGETEDYTVSISGGINPPPYLSFTWSNNLSSALSATNLASVQATNINANETYYITATKIDGCQEIDSVHVSVNCGSNLQLTLFLQGYYDGLSTMKAVLMNQGIGANVALTDSITVELHDSAAPHNLVSSQLVALNTNGTATCNFNQSGSFYIAIKHRNSIETWSATPILLGSSSTYNFTDSASKAYGSNQINVDAGKWAFYAGDINQDDNIDLADIAELEVDLNNFAFGYFDTDLSGDGNVDLADVPFLEVNLNSFIFSQQP